METWLILGMQFAELSIQGDGVEKFSIPFHFSEEDDKTLETGNVLFEIRTSFIWIKPELCHVKLCLVDVFKQCTSLLNLPDIRICANFTLEILIKQFFNQTSLSFYKELSRELVECSNCPDEGSESMSACYVLLFFVEYPFEDAKRFKTWFVSMNFRRAVSIDSLASNISILELLEIIFSPRLAIYAQKNQVMIQVIQHLLLEIVLIYLDDLVSDTIITDICHIPAITLYLLLDPKHA